MRAHAIIDALRRGVPDGGLGLPDLIQRAEKFSFDPGTINDEVDKGAEAFARDLLKCGVFPSPYDVTLFEFGPHGLVESAKFDCFTWALVWKEVDGENERLLFKAFFMLPHDGKGVFINPALGEFNYKSPSEKGTWGTFRILGLERTAVDRYSSSAAALRTDAAARSKLLEGIDLPGMPSAHKEAVSIDLLERGDDAMVATCQMQMEVTFHHLLVAIGLLNTRGVDLPLTAAPKFMNAARKRKGKPPIFSFRTLVVDPSAVRIPGGALGADRTAPRLHWRRGHVRRLSGGRVTMVRPCLVGDGHKGFVAKDYEIDVSAGLAHQPTSTE